MRKFDVLRWLEWAQADAATITMLVPVQYRRLMQEPRFDEFDLSSLQLKYCTSAPFPAELKREVLARMPGALIEIYSMTEGGVVCLLEAHKFPDKLHTVGRPAPGSELKVLDDGDRPVAPGEAGNLIGRSQTMMAGYKNQPDKTREGYWTDPETGEVWQRMGDIGRVDAEGFVELVGRAKDMIISGGFNIFPVDLEEELAKEDDVIEAAVIGMPSERWGETPVGFVTLAEGARDCEDIRAAVNARLGKTQRLAQLHPIEEMPRSHIGKLLKTDLREEAAPRRACLKTSKITSMPSGWRSVSRRGADFLGEGEECRRPRLYSLPYRLAGAGGSKAGRWWRGRPEVTAAWGAVLRN